MNVLVTYPKSASDWICYILEHIYLRPTSDDSNKRLIKSNNVYKKLNLSHRLDIPEETSVLFIKKHYMSKSKLVFNSDDIMLFTYRDPKETVFSYNFGKEHRSASRASVLPDHVNFHKYIKTHYNRLHHEFREWMYNFKTYRQYEGKKHLINYTNLLKDPESEILKIMKCFGYDTDAKYRYKEFIKNINTHTTNCINYKVKPGHLLNNTFGTKMKYEYNLLTPAEHSIIDEKMERFCSATYKLLQEQHP